jgi:hypothetical protein
VNRSFKKSPSRRKASVKGRKRVRRTVGFFAKVRLALSMHKRRMTVKSRSAQIANIRRLNLRYKGRPPRKPRKTT